jgi:hypothetical protein
LLSAFAIVGKVSASAATARPNRNATFLIVCLLFYEVWPCRLRRLR